MKVAFFYFHGTDPFLGQIGSAIGRSFSQPALGLLNVPGITNGATWLDGVPRNDCFTALLDPNIFQSTRIQYPALGFPMSASINIGIAALMTAINLLPSGQKFMIGGYSQGAVVAGSVYRKIKNGELGARGNDFLGGVCFGSPIRQQDYRGEVGGTWSGTWDQLGSTGGHGSFPTTGPFPRLTNCDSTKWIEFADYGDIFTCTGNSQRGQNWTTGCGAFVNLLNIPAIIAAVTTAWSDIQEAFTVGAQALNYTDAAGRAFSFGGNGHAAYPWRPPPGNPDGALTSYQIAVKWLTGKAYQYAVGPISMFPSNPFSPTSAGWSTSLT